MPRSIFLRCRNAAGLYSIVQAKFFAYLFTCQARPSLSKSLLRQLAVLKVFDIVLDQLPRKIALRPSGVLGKLGQSVGYSRTESYMQHRRIHRDDSFTVSNLTKANLQVCRMAKLRGPAKA